MTNPNQSFTAKDAKDAEEINSLTAEDAKDAEEKNSFTAKDAEARSKNKAMLGVCGST